LTFTTVGDINSLSMLRGQTTHGLSGAYLFFVIVFLISVYYKRLYVSICWMLDW